MDIELIWLSENKHIPLKNVGPVQCLSYALTTAEHKFSALKNTSNELGLPFKALKGNDLTIKREVRQDGEVLFSFIVKLNSYLKINHCSR